MKSLQLVGCNSSTRFTRAGKKTSKVVALVKNSDPLNRPSSDAHFIRRTPGSKRFENRKPSLRYKRARIYSAQLGRFISRDPLGFVDGMSLYRAYFVPGSMDPFGLASVTCDCKGHADTSDYKVTVNCPSRSRYNQCCSDACEGNGSGRDDNGDGVVSGNEVESHWDGSWTSGVERYPIHPDNGPLAPDWIADLGPACPSVPEGFMRHCVSSCRLQHFAGWDRGVQFCAQIWGGDHWIFYCLPEFMAGQHVDPKDILSNQIGITISDKSNNCAKSSQLIGPPSGDRFVFWRKRI